MLPMKPGSFVPRLRRGTEDQKKNKTGNLRSSAETTGYSGEGCPSTGKEDYATLAARDDH
jgi:hypothetical protein